MNDLIQDILDCITNPMHRMLKVSYYPDGGVVFEIYDVEIPIVYEYDDETNTHEWVIPTEMLMDNKIDAEMLAELSAIMNLIITNESKILLVENE